MGYIFSTRYYRNVNSGLVVCATTRSGLPLHKILNMRLLSTLAIAVAVCCHGTVQAQLELTALGVAATEDFPDLPVRVLMLHRMMACWTLIPGS